MISEKDEDIVPPLGVKRILSSVIEQVEVKCKKR